MSFISLRREITYVCKTNLLVTYCIKIAEQAQVISFQQNDDILNIRCAKKKTNRRIEHGTTQVEKNNYFLEQGSS